MKKIFILIGPPGSGKGTQADLLKQKLNFNSFSGGEIFRNEIAKKTKLGKRVEPYMKAGRLVPVKIVCQIIISKLARSRKSVILDGFPRNLEQAKILDEFFNQEKNKYKVKVIEIHLPKKEILTRITGRRLCDCGGIFHVKFKPPKNDGFCDACGKKLKIRADAKPAVVKTRIKSYQQETTPVIKFYKEKKYYKYYCINGLKTIKQIQAQINKLVK